MDIPSLAGSDSPAIDPRCGQRPSNSHPIATSSDTSPYHRRTNRIAVLSDRGGRENIWLVNDAGELQPFTNDPFGAGFPVFLPAGDMLLAVLRSGDPGVWATPVQGGRPQQPEFLRDVDCCPSYSADGLNVAYGRDDGVWVASLARGEPRQVSVDLELMRRPLFSPDGTWVSNIRYVAGAGPRLVRVPADGGGDATPITDLTIFNYVWAAEDDELYFTTLTGAEIGNIWAVSADGSGLRPLTDFTDRPGTLGGEALATDGRFIYFTWEEDVGDIWIADLVQDDGR